MIIKTFSAESSAAALKKVREEMGGEAIVLRSGKTVDRNNQTIFEVTACLERPTVARSSQILSDGPRPASQPGPKPVAPQAVTPKVKTPVEPETVVIREDGNDDWRAKISDIDRKLNRLLKLGFQTDGVSRLEMFQGISRQLKEADLPDEYIENLMGSLMDAYDGLTDVESFVRGNIVREFSSMMLPSMTFKPGDKLIFVGPPGSGKSSVMGKLAAFLVVVQKQKVKLITLDDIKMAASDEIYSYAEVLGVEVVNPFAAESKNAKYDDAIVLIDAPAMPKEPEKIQSLKTRVDFVNPQYRFAVFSCLTRSKDIYGISKQVKELSPTHLIMTMQDLTDCYGSMVTAAKATGLKIAFTSDSPAGNGNLRTPDPDMLARQLLNAGVSCE